MRTFASGATRDKDDTKHDFDGFFSPLALERFAEYMTKHRVQADGKVRDSDNWQKGIPLDVYRKSSWRHFFEFWKAARGYTTKESVEESACALLFNIMGYLHEHLKAMPSSDPFLVERRGVIEAWPHPAAIVERIEQAKGGAR